MSKLELPQEASSIQKGVPLKLVLDKPAVTQLAANLSLVYPAFDIKTFTEETLADLEPLTLKERSYRIALGIKSHLPNNYSEAIEILLKSLTPPLKETSDLGLSGMFYMPHVSFVEQFGLD